MSTVDGKTLADCFALVARCGREINGLSEMLTNMLTETIAARRSDLPFVLSGGSQDSSRTDESNWVCTDISSSLPLKATGKGRWSTERYVGFQISTAEDGIAIPDNKEPLLHVFCWEAACSFEHDLYMGFPVSNNADYPCEVIYDRLIRWGSHDDNGWNQNEWTYSLRLTALNSAEDLEKYIVAPAISLLRGLDVLLALPDAWLEGALVRYPNRDALIES